MKEAQIFRNTTFPTENMSLLNLLLNQLQQESQKRLLLEESVRFLWKEVQIARKLVDMQERKAAILIQK